MIFHLGGVGFRIRQYTAIGGDYREAAAGGFTQVANVRLIRLAGTKDNAPVFFQLPLQTGHEGAFCHAGREHVCGQQGNGDQAGDDRDEFKENARGHLALLDFTGLRTGSRSLAP